MKERIEKDEENTASQKQELSNCHSEIVKLSNGELHKLSREARSAATDRVTGDEAMLKRQKQSNEARDGSNLADHGRETRHGARCSSYLVS